MSSIPLHVKEVMVTPRKMSPSGYSLNIPGYQNIVRRIKVPDSWKDMGFLRL